MDRCRSARNDEDGIGASRVANTDRFGDDSRPTRKNNPGSSLNMSIEKMALRCRRAVRPERSNRFSAGAKLSRPRDHAGDSICARRQHLDRRPRHRRQDERTARREGRRRQPARRRRHRRHQGGREKRSRWLHAVARLHRHARDRSLAVQESRLRSAQGLCADRHDRQCAEFAGGASVIPRQNRRRTDRLCEGQSRQGQFRLGRRRHRQPHHRRIFCPRRRHQAGAYPLQGHGTCADGSVGRPHPDGVRADPGFAFQCRGRKTARAGGNQHDPLGPAA